MDNDRSKDQIKKIKKDIYDILQIMKGLDSDVKEVRGSISNLKHEVKRYDARNLTNVFNGETVDAVDDIETKIKVMEDRIRLMNNRTMTCAELESLESRIDRYISCQVEKKLEEVLGTINTKFNSIDTEIKNLNSKIVRHKRVC